MQRFSRIFSLAAAAVCLGLPLLLGACADKRYATVKPAPGANSSPTAYSGAVRADIGAAYNACLARCNENTSLGAVTREGCFKGCAEVRRRVKLRDEDFSSRQECADALREIDINRDLYIEDNRRWCDQQWEHLHKRKGCYDAITVFYNNLTEGSVCGGGYSYTPAQAYDRATGASGASGVSTAPLAPVYASGAAGAAGAADSAQAAPQSPAYAAPSGQYLQDTPKYQTGYRSGKKKTAPAAKAQPAAKTSGKSKGKKAASVAQPAPKPVEKDTPMPDKDASAPAATQVPAQAAPAAAPAAQIAPQMSDGPTLSVPRQGSAPATPAAPAAQTAPVAPVPATPSPATPAPAVQTPATTVPATPAPATPAAPAAQPAPMPPAPPAAPPSDGVIPPIPSMLEQPYNPPAVIAPQEPGGR